MRLRTAVVVLAPLGGVALASTAALQANEIVGQTSSIQQARRVCGPRGRCFRCPNWRGAYGSYGRRPWGWRHRWRRW
jgi:hypothetical protein